MPSSNELRGLLGEILRSQPDRPEAVIEPFRDTPGDTRRLREAINGRRPLNADERGQLLRSPRARARFVRVATELRAETRAHWRRSGIIPDLVYQAAADNEIRPVKVEDNPDFGVSLYPLDPQGRSWTVSLRLSPRVMDGLPGQVRLLDSDGGLWLQGRPDDDGEISADWPLPGSPLERLRRFSLSIEPV